MHSMLVASYVILPLLPLVKITLMLVGIGCLLVFLVMAWLMFTRRLSSILALPIMALSIAIIGGVPGPDIVSKVISEGSLKLHNAYTTTMFGAVLAELMNQRGIARSLIRWVAEFAGDNPFIMGVMLTLVTAVLFSTLGGLGAVIMVGTIVLPVMLSLGISNVTAGGLYLFGISLGGMFNLSNWQLYIDVLKIRQSEIIGFVLPFAGIIAVMILVFLGLELRKLKNLGYILSAVAAIGLGLAAVSLSFHSESTGVSVGVDPGSIEVAAAVFILCVFYALFRQKRRITSTPGIALATPIVPLVLVLFCHWDIIAAFVSGIAYGTMTTWECNSLTRLTRSIFDGIAAVIPAVVLMIGIGMLLSSVMHPRVAVAMAPLLASVIPTHALPYILIFTVCAPLALYRGPLSLWGMGSGLVVLIQHATLLPVRAIMSMLMSVGQIQGISDPTNTHNIWIATYLGTDTQILLKRTLPYAWTAVFCGLCLAAVFRYVCW